MILGTCCGCMATFWVILGGLGVILGGLGDPLGGLWEALGDHLGAFRWPVTFFLGVLCRKT